jgi:sigma-E factor negative regulatory protein RseC
MDHPQGTVVLLDAGDTGVVRALVEVVPSAVCPRCAAGKGCGAGILGAGSGTRRVEVPVPAGMALAIGDRVAVSLMPENLLAAASIAYGLPLAGAVLGAMAGLYMGAGDLLAAVTASMGLAGGILAARLRLRRGACLQRFVPVIHARVPATDAGRR